MGFNLFVRAVIVVTEFVILKYHLKNQSKIYAAFIFFAQIIFSTAIEGKNNVKGLIKCFTSFNPDKGFFSSF